VKRLAFVVVTMLGLFTVLSIALEPAFRFTTLVSLGFIDVYPFDLAFVAVVLCLLATGALHFRRELVPANRYVIWICAAYIVYQLLVVLPVAVFAHDMRLIDVLKDQEPRLAVLYIPFFYSVALRCLKPATIVAVFDVAALVLVLWVFTRYAATGGQGYWDGSLYRLRAVWGGASLAFAWLLFSSLFYWPLRPWRLAFGALALGGIVLANHRSGILALAVALTAQGVVLRGVFKRVLAMAAVVIVISVGVYMASPFVRSSVAYSLRTLVDPSADINASDRVERSVLGLAYFAHHPFGDYIWNQRYYLVSLGDRDFAPHNMVIQLLATQGAIATLLLMALIVGALVIAWRNRASRLSAVMFAYLTYYAVFCLFNTNIDSPENFSLFCAAVGLILHDNRARSATSPDVSPDAVPPGCPLPSPSDGILVRHLTPA